MQIFVNHLSDLVDIFVICLQTKNLGLWDPPVSRKVGKGFWEYFQIQTAKNARVAVNFDVSFLGNCWRFLNSAKSFWTFMIRTSKYMLTSKIWDWPTPPPCPLMGRGGGSHGGEGPIEQLRIEIGGFLFIFLLTNCSMRSKWCQKFLKNLTS